MLPPAPTFLGLDAIASHLRRSFDDIAVVTVERVLNRNDNERVASVDLSPEALAAFLPARDAEPTPGSPERTNALQASQEDQREAVLAWLRHTFATNMLGKPSEKFKVGLWKPKREALVGSVRVLVSGMPPTPEPAPPPPAQIWELLLPNGERIVTSDPDIVDAHRRLLEASVRGMVVYGEQVQEFLEIVMRSDAIERRQLALEAKVRMACGFPPDHDFHPRERSNVLPFQGSPKP